MLILAGVLAVSAIVISCKTTPPIADDHSPIFKDGYIQVRHAINLSPSDLKKFNHALSAHSTELYKVKYYKDGEPVKTVGKGCVTGSAVEMVEKMVDAIAKKEGSTNVAIQISARKMPVEEQTKQAPKGNTASCFVANNLAAEADALVAKVTPIIKSYSTSQR